MRIDWDVPITVDDGVVLRADVFRPERAGKYPVILSYGPYGKWLHFEDLYTDQWRRMVEQHPDVPAGSTNKYQNWEVDRKSTRLNSSHASLSRMPSSA